MSNSTPQEKLWSGSFVYFFILIFLIQHVFGITMPTVPGFIQFGLGLNIALAGTLTSVFALVCLITRPLSGVAGDRLNKKVLTVISTCLTGVAVILHAYAPNASMIVLVRVVHGIAFAFSLTIAFAMAVAYVPKSRLGEGVGYLAVSTLVGGVLGPFVGSSLIDLLAAKDSAGTIIDIVVGYRSTFLVGGAILIVAGLSLAFFKYVPPAPPPGAPIPPRRPITFSSFIAPELLPLVFFVTIAAIPPGINGAFLRPLGIERGISGFALFFIMNAIVQLVTRPTIGKLIDRKGSAFVAIPGYILFAIGMLWIGHSYTLPSLLGAAAVMALGLSTLPALQTDCFRKLDPSRRALASGMYFMGMDLGQGLGQLGGGIITRALGGKFEGTYIIACAALIFGCLLYALYVGAAKKRAKASASAV